MATAKAATEYKNGKDKKATAQQVSEKVSNATDKVAAAAQETTAQVKNQIDELAAAARDMELDLNKYANDAKTFVRQNPGTSIALAAGVGLLIGALTTQRRR